VDDTLPVSSDDAEDMARRLAGEEALFAGTSSGANVVAAIHVAERLGPGAKVVTLMVDSGLKYLSTDVYRSRSRHASRLRIRASKPAESAASPADDQRLAWSRRFRMATGVQGGI
jgi:threonine synthase